MATTKKKTKPVTVRFTVSAPKKTLQKIDALADAHGRSRPYYVNLALQMWEKAGCPV